MPPNLINKGPEEVDKYSKMQVFGRLKTEWLEMAPSGMSILGADLSQFTSTLSFMGSRQEFTAGPLTGP